MAFRWRADDGPFIEVFGSSLHSSTKQIVVKVGPPLSKLSGSAYVKAETGLDTSSGVNRRTEDLNTVAETHEGRFLEYIPTCHAFDL